MEFLGFSEIACLFCVAIIGGLVDSIAGGGGLITVPVLMAVGITPAQALATNKLQSSFGSCCAAISYAQGGVVDVRTLGPAIICTAIGAALGTVSVQLIDAQILSNVIPFLLIGVILFFLCQRRMGETDRQERIPPLPFYVLFGLGFGFYDGFFGPGTGSFWSTAFVFLLGFNLLKATGHTKVVNFTSNITALIFFALGGQVVWTAGLLMGFGQVLGARVGSKMAMAWGAKLVRPLLIVISMLLTVQLIYWDPTNIIHRGIARLVGTYFR